jgi:hypothetical protein
MRSTIVEVLRSGKQADADGVMVQISRQACEEAADMLEFFFGQMHIQSPQMNGQHTYRFINGGWPMTHCKGPTSCEAVRAAISEVRRDSKEKSNEMP